MFLSSFQNGVRYIKDHPHLLFAFLLTIVLPLCFLYASNQFLEAGKSYQERTQKDKVGILQDSFASMLRVSHFDATYIQQEILYIAKLNPDITKFRVAVHQNNAIVPIAAIDSAVVGVPEYSTELYGSATVHQDESLIFEFYVEKERIWQAFRSVTDTSGQTYFIFTEFSLASTDALLASKKTYAYIVAAAIYIVVLLIAYWLVRITDYRYLYIESKKAMETRDLFTHTIAHELRTPLTAIEGYASMALETDEIQKKREYEKQITTSATRLLAIVNDLLDIARIQSGNMHVDIKNTQLSGIVESVITELSSMAHKKNIALAHTSEPSVTVCVDKKRMYQALINIVSNAIKYTKEGHIEVAYEVKDAVCEIRVKDTGMGIPADDQKKLFAPFFRASSEDVSAITGTGLGMWITRQFIEKMGGSIGVESIKGVGTHVVITVPIPKSS